MMDREAKGDLILSGSGESGGGSFSKVVINGSGKITGDVNCEHLECNGSGKIYGNITSDYTLIQGSTDIQGSLTSEDIKVHGDSEVNGKVVFGEMEVNGHVKVDESLKGDTIHLEGMMKVKGDCEVETADLNGAFTIGGLLNGDRIDIELQGKSKVKEIGGETITVKRSSPSLLKLDKLIKSWSKELHADLIEGDQIKLQYTKAKVVRGNNVEIGPGCEIELVEYGNDLQVSDKATVDKTEKLS
ncbi:polymer-forming cytoskeletal protein [Bacillus salacetis]|uniref:polymer-forming cytoskeletal protein n=1 Tax=Bacillus salacetis TaxID=2315464 RepID=UPI003BA0F400